MPKVGWVQYKTYSGCRIGGTQSVRIPNDSPLHMERAYYLTAQLEAPKYGSVQSYDGAGMSGGPLHNIAVYPRGLKQGSLFPLLRSLERGNDGAALQALWERLASVGWYVARDGVLRNTQSGAPITGRAIRNEFSPPNGKVPNKGPDWEKARTWAVLFHNLFSDPSTFKAQREFAIEYLINTQEVFEKKFYGAMNLNTLRVSATPEDNALTLDEDLALCFYHSNSVNGPGPAKKCLERVINRLSPIHRGNKFARQLIWELGKYKYGRWQDTADGRNRYDRTRISAQRSGLWPQEFFEGDDALMPKDLPKTRPK